MQTGNVKFAPMQPFPPTKITATNTSPLHPTSSVVIATTHMKPPVVSTTITQLPTWAVTSKENQVRFSNRLRTRVHPISVHPIPFSGNDADPRSSPGYSCAKPQGRHAEIPKQMERLISKWHPGIARRAHGGKLILVTTTAGAMSVAPLLYIIY
jgi:hypothetical protein